MTSTTPAYGEQRDRTRSPAPRDRSRSRRRSYSHSRSPNRRDGSADRRPDEYRREDRRERSDHRDQRASFGNDRAEEKEQNMNAIRDSSQQERRVYVGNLSYEVKWHHLKDFMRAGQSLLSDAALVC
jgi:hypothetical protein